MALTKTTWVDIEGKIYWAKLYQPDEFRGAVRWTAEFAPSGEAEWNKIKELGIQKRPKENKNGIEEKHINILRPTFKLMKGKMIYFAPPFIFDQDGVAIVKYVGEDGKDVRSYEEKNKKITRVGDGPLIGNGSLVSVNLCVYPTAMGTGFRLESVKLLDLIEYVKLEAEEEEISANAEGEDSGAPW